MNSFSVQLCCQPSHLLLDESKVFVSHSNSYHDRNRNCKSESEKRKAISAGFGNTSTSFWYTCSSVFLRVGHKSRSGHQIKRRILFQLPLFYFFSCFHEPRSSQIQLHFPSHLQDSAGSFASFKIKYISFCQIFVESGNAGPWQLIKRNYIYNNDNDDKYFFRSGSEAVLPLVPVKEPEEMTTKMSTTQNMMPAFGVFSPSLAKN